MSRADIKYQFSERFSRLKAALNVKTDTKLSELWDIRTQPVAGEKRRCTMPVAWLEEAGNRGASLDYIFLVSCQLFVERPPLKIRSLKRLTLLK